MAPRCSRMLADDAALADVAEQKGGLLDSLPKGGIHICSGTHGVTIIKKLTAQHQERGQILVTAPMLGRPEVVASGQAGVVIGGPADALAQCKPLFDAIGRRSFEAGADPAAAAAIKIANNFVLGCAIEAMGEGFSLVRKYGVLPHGVLRRDDRRTVQLLGLQGLRQDHGGRELRKSRPDGGAWA